MINAKIREFENDIINYVNLCGDVPIEAKYLVFKDILNQIKEEANRQVTVEREQMKLAKERSYHDGDQNHRWSHQYPWKHRSS